MSYIGNKPADTIASSSDIADGAITAAKLASSSVTQPKINGGVAGTGPAFSASTAYTINVSSATTTVATGFNAATFDTASAFNTSTGRFQPTVAGYYQLNSQADFGTNGVGAASVIQTGIYKNGTTNVVSAGYASSATSFSIASVSTVVYLNGSTDYVQATLYQNSGSTANGAKSFFSGALIRAA